MKRMRLLFIAPLIVLKLCAMNSASNEVVKLWTLPFTPKSARPGYEHKITDPLTTVVEQGVWADLNRSLVERSDLAQIINAQDEQGDTPLHKAAQQNDFTKGSLLLHHGAKPSIEILNEEEERPEDCLQSDGLNEGDLFRFLCLPKMVFAYMLKAASADLPYEFEPINLPPLRQVLFDSENPHRAAVLVICRDYWDFCNYRPGQKRLRSEEEEDDDYEYKDERPDDEDHLLDDEYANDD